jgi:hypothetical protein
VIPKPHTQKAVKLESLAPGFGEHLLCYQMENRHFVV